MLNWKPPLKLDGELTLVVDNQILLLGLDYLYRERMKRFETDKLLPEARNLAQYLHIKEIETPIEGYYSETLELTTYFRLMRALQNVDAKRASEIVHLADYQHLFKVCSSPIFGRSVETGKLLPAGRDPLAQALKDFADTGQIWQSQALVEAAHQIAITENDCSLVGLAARTKDLIVLTALRESVILYAEIMHFGIAETPEYKFEWHVEPEMAQAANRFILIANELVENISPLPGAVPANAELFCAAFYKNQIVGRCARLGTSSDSQHYHWAIRLQENTLAFEEFWSEIHWTTEMYRESLTNPPSQGELWRRVNEIKRRVHNTLGTTLSFEFRSEQAYKAYTGLCGEAQMAYEDQELSKELVRFLADQADKVIALHHQSKS